MSYKCFVTFIVVVLWVLIYPLFNMKPVFQQVLLKDGCAFRVVVVVDVVTLTPLLGAILHDDVTTLQRIISVGSLPTGVGTHDDAHQPCLYPLLFIHLLVLLPLPSCR